MFNFKLVGGFGGKYVFVFIVKIVKEGVWGILVKRNNIFVIFKVVGKCMVRFYICGYICVGI